MFCSKCGNKIEDGVKFCTNCGAKIELENVVKIQMEEAKEKITEVKEQAAADIAYINNRGRKDTKTATILRVSSKLVLLAMIIIILFFAYLIATSSYTSDKYTAAIIIILSFVAMCPIAVLCESVAKLIDKVG